MINAVSIAPTSPSATLPPPTVGPAPSFSPPAPPVMPAAVSTPPMSSTIPAGFAPATQAPPANSFTPPSFKPPGAPPMPTNMSASMPPTMPATSLPPVPANIQETQTVTAVGQTQTESVTSAKPAGFMSGLFGGKKEKVDSVGVSGSGAGGNDPTQKHVKVSLPLALGALAMVLLVIGGGVAFYLSTQTTEIRQQASGSAEYAAADGTRCPAGYTFGQGDGEGNLCTLVNTSTDSKNCGGTGNSCSNGEACFSGVCGCGAAGSSCPSGNVCRSGVCENANNGTGAQNCGGSGNTCSNGTTCFSGTCGCGAAGVTCSTGQTCSNGVCTGGGGGGSALPGGTTTNSQSSGSSNSGSSSSSNSTSSSGGTTSTACGDQTPVNTQFRASGTGGAWLSGDDLTAANYKKGQTVDVNCFAKGDGASLLTGAFIVVTDPAGTSTTVSNTGSLTSYTAQSEGKYTFTCKSNVLTTCNDADSFTIAAGTAATATPTPTPTVTTTTSETSTTTTPDSRSTVPSNGETPVTGQTDNTIMVIVAGVFFIIGGKMFWNKRSEW